MTKDTDLWAGTRTAIVDELSNLIAVPDADSSSKREHRDRVMDLFDQLHAALHPGARYTVEHDGQLAYVQDHLQPRRARFLSRQDAERTTRRLNSGETPGTHLVWLEA